MIKKLLMLLLAILFILALVYMFVRFEKNNRFPENKVRVEELSPTASPNVSLVSPTPTISPELQEIENDLKNIEKDLQKVKSEDNRLVPPEFIFDLGV